MLPTSCWTEKFSAAEDSEKDPLRSSESVPAVFSLKARLLFDFPRPPPPPPLLLPDGDDDGPGSASQIVSSLDPSFEGASCSQIVSSRDLLLMADTDGRREPPIVIVLLTIIFFCKKSTKGKGRLGKKRKECSWSQVKISDSPPFPESFKHQ